MEKFKGKYRSDTTRLKNWDYRWDAVYFITICTKDRESYFGEIKNGEMILSNVGVLADVFWHEIKNHTKNVELDAFVVMPNHVHGILIINNDLVPICRDVACNVPTDGNAPTFGNTPINEFMSSISPKSGSVSTIIRSYKSAVTKHANRLGLPMAWQSRFYDNIIRNNQAYSNIQNYIINNPTNWPNDKLFGNSKTNTEK